MLHKRERTFLPECWFSPWMLQNLSGWETSFTSWLENALAAVVGESHKGSHSKTKCWWLQCLPTGAQTYLRPHLGDFRAHSWSSCFPGQKVKRTAELATQPPLLPLPWHWSKGRLTTRWVGGWALPLEVIQMRWVEGSALPLEDLAGKAPAHL